MTTYQVTQLFSDTGGSKIEELRECVCVCVCGAVGLGEGGLDGGQGKRRKGNKVPLNSLDDGLTISPASMKVLTCRVWWWVMVK